ncbi:glycosyl transferase family 1 [Arcicella aurantiaca]|uniref:Glycosyl transferase family 1 n=1 Tax=Arcicella aurantiaca TaxID=591202 RepID=A0A316DG59_9BACT|nr:glycosyltransferase [Arcicella aurantiaca]PWK16895.1 glycosyl transferase family 1 [Arcicella aurantiaca]
MTKNILIFEPDASGHHSGYLYHLIINFLSANYHYNLTVLVAPDFFEQHPQIIEETLSPKVKWLAFSEAEFSAWKITKSESVTKRAFFEWDLLRKYITQTNATYAFSMYIDYLQIALLTQKALPCPVSGILFRPTLVNYPAHSLKEKLNTLRKNLTLKLFVKSKKLDSLFNLDPFATEYIKQNWQTSKVVFLPDPVQVYPSTKAVAEIKQELGIEENRNVFLIFGFLDCRKGISEVMEAVGKISKENSQKGTLLIVGPWEESEKLKFDKKLKEIEGISDFQIITQNTFIADHDIQPYFEVSDYILALYDKHIGMSAITVRAAAAQKPLLTYNFGLMGKIVVENELGLIVNNDLSEKIEMLLMQKVVIGNKQKMKQYAELNRAENYAKVILNSF